MSEAMKKQPEEENELDIPLSKDNIDLVRRHLEVGDRSVYFFLKTAFSPTNIYPSIDPLISAINWTSEFTDILEKYFQSVSFLNFYLGTSLIKMSSKFVNLYLSQFSLEP